MSSKAKSESGYDPWRRRPGRGEPVNISKYVVFEPGLGRFPLVADGKAAPLLVSPADYPGVIRAVSDLRADIGRVTQIEPDIYSGQIPVKSEAVLIGTLGRSSLIDSLIQDGKLNVNGVAGRWETWILEVIDNPLPGINRALVIAGSGQRGTIYGVYDLSKQIGISPWHWWDDVPPKRHSSLYILPGRYTLGEPAVKYRGFFINDENPATGNWAPNYFGPGLAPGYPDGLNHHYWAKVFELMLRLKANYLWPAVWGRAFAEDDPENHATAKLYGVVIGTSHEGPMMRGIEEWNRHVIKDASGNIIGDPYGGNGCWSFRSNSEALKAYWREGIQRMVRQGFEGIVTLGMRGPGDLSLPEEDGFPLMDQVIRAQREILAEVTGQDMEAPGSASIPQLWVLYKEVQEWWRRGLRVPGDVTVMFCDDNWGNICQLPRPDDPERSGGYGLYYHFDYVGAGRNYKWVDTNLLPNIWEQLHLAYCYGVDRIWMVNVGDLKGMEFSLEFFLDYAWNPESLPVERIPEWERQWAKEQFGPEKAAMIAGILHEYSKLQSVRKPELLNRKITLNPNIDITANPEAAVIYTDECPFSLIDYREMERVVARWRRLALAAEDLRRTLPPEAQDAYFELVFYQVKASALLYELRLAGFKNLLYHRQGRAGANDLAAIAEEMFAASQALAGYYNNTLAGGKWKGFQTQPYLAYGGPYPNSSWQQPETGGKADPDFIWPYLKRLEVPAMAVMGVAIDGSDKYWPQEPADPVLPAFSPFQQQPPQYIEIFNRGAAPFEFRIQPADTWISVWPNQGVVEKEVRAIVRVDWPRAPKGTARTAVSVIGPNGINVKVQAVAENPVIPESGLPEGFIESNGYVSMEADHYFRAVNSPAIQWRRVPDIGRTGSGMTPFPVDAPRQTPGGDTPRLEYRMLLFNGGTVVVWVYLSPRNNVLGGDGLKYAVSFDDGEPQILNITTVLNGIPMNKSWARNTSDNVNLTATTHHVPPGEHTLKFWMVDPTVILQKIVVDTGGLKPSYLGPPESLRVKR
ncbi:MAG: glycosyl hydrolase 115 family protein [Firmicutes bacterium]|nr:glycosyl hydrolase 115 family protein [Bacillota bacterium]